MITIALTGGIGSGKSTVCNIFHELGQQQDHDTIVKIIDADQIAKNLLSGSLDKPDSSALAKVHHLFGADVFNNKRLDRLKLRQLIFSSSTKKQQLESLLHPLVFQEIFSQIKTYSHNEQQEEKNLIVIIAIPLLLETHSEKKFDRVLIIDSSIDLQIERTIKRDQCSEQLIKQIIQTQVDRQTRLDCADDIIDNSGTYESLYQQIEKLFQYYSSLS